MSRRRNLWISLAAAVLSCLLVYGMYAALIRQVELQETVRVVVPKNFIKTGTLITGDMVELHPIYRGAWNKHLLNRLDDVVGKEAVVPLGTDEPVLDWKLDKFHLLPGKDQATFQIPKEYIFSLAGGIRAGDRVIVYASGKTGTYRILPQEVTVASVRSSANVEVDDPKHPNLLSKINGDVEKMYASRRESNGAVDQINLNLTEQEWLSLDDACRNKQARLVIAFSASSLAGKE